MGCDIHPFVEVQMDDGTWVEMGSPARLHDRTYGRFAFLTGGMVRNYSGVPRVLPEPRGYPDDCSKYAIKYQEDTQDDWGNHSASYLTLAELLAVDYDQTFTDVREPPAFAGRGSTELNQTTLREFLGQGWFDILKELQDLATPGTANRIRIVFDFDS